ncbi:MAG TPA: hypothetical protein VMT51_08400 [Dongiaceae bacterium]|nr:hypothetical protein [Dongiaceae bacterium]
MKSVWLFRISAAVLFLFGALHTFGFLTFRPKEAAGLAVWNAMNEVHFHEGNGIFSYGAFYRGFGLFVTMAFFFCALVGLHLANTVKKNPVAVGWLGWALFALQAANLVLAWRYFGAPQIAFSLLAAACTGLAAATVPGAAKLHG